MWALRVIECGCAAEKSVLPLLRHEDVTIVRHEDVTIGSAVADKLEDVGEDLDYAAEVLGSNGKVLVAIRRAGIRAKRSAKRTARSRIGPAALTSEIELIKKAYGDMEMPSERQIAEQIRRENAEGSEGRLIEGSGKIASRLIEATAPHGRGASYVELNSRAMPSVLVAIVRVVEPPDPVTKPTRHFADHSIEWLERRHVRAFEA